MINLPTFEDWSNLNESDSWRFAKEDPVPSEFDLKELKEAHGQFVDQLRSEGKIIYEDSSIFFPDFV